MSTPSVQEAGNEFEGSFETALAAEMEAPAEPEVSPSDEAPAEPLTWEDAKSGEDPDKSAPQSDSEKPRAAPATLEIKTGKGVKKFDLTPENQELVKELQLAQGARQWQRERDEARKTKAEVEAALAKERSRAGVWDEIQSLAQAGQSERVVRAVLGDKFDAFRKQMLGEELGYENGSPEDRAAIEKSRVQRDRDFEKYTYERKLADREAKLSQIEDTHESTRLKTIGTSALQQHDFRRTIQDPDVAQALNDKLWRLAWSDLEDAAEAGQDISPDVITAAFEQNAKVLGAGRNKQVEANVTKVLETKKQDAVKRAQIAATERYPTTKPDVSGWDGRRSKDLLRLLVKGK